MELEVIKRAGLSEPQAKTYLALMRGGEMAPNAVAKETGETRTNTYAILEIFAIMTSYAWESKSYQEYCTLQRYVFNVGFYHRLPIRAIAIPKIHLAR